jgi:hypothetical protein
VHAVVVEPVVGSRQDVYRAVSVQSELVKALAAYLYSLPDRALYLLHHSLGAYSLPNRAIYYIIPLEPTHYR